MEIIHIILIIFVICIIYNCNSQIENFFSFKKEIPKTIISTYYKKEKIPNKVFKNIKQYAPNYKYFVYDDNQILKFLRDNYDDNLILTFNQLKGAHKADLFRYCYLYKKGGIYLDIKTELIKKLDQVFNVKDTQFYTVLSGGRYKDKTVYQGIIATLPNNPIFEKLINYMVNLKKPVKHYQIFTIDFYNQLKKKYLPKKKKYLKPGFYKGDFNLYLFIEKCTTKKCDCYDGLDRYKRCCYIYNNDQKIIKTRYAEYPW
jgi:hypothetical protein